MSFVGTDWFIGMSSDVKSRRLRGASPLLTKRTKKWNGVISAPNFPGFHDFKVP